MSEAANGDLVAVRLRPLVTVISSPCIKICEIEPQSRLCRGCGRSLDEIARWGSLSEPQRLAVMRVLAERMRDAGMALVTPP